MVTLVTYLPFYRIHEINEYFMRNVELMRPRNAIVYIDNVYHERQKEIIGRAIPNSVEVRLGNWRNRNNTWLAMLREFNSVNDEVIVVDSDNVMDKSMPLIHEELRKYPLYSILDEEAWTTVPWKFLIRSRRIGGIVINNEERPLYAYKVYDDAISNVFRGIRGPTFFIGPKQVIAFMKLPDIEIINKLERALNRVDPWLRSYISDETLLGIIAHLMGVVEVPWTVASHHHHHGSTPNYANKLLVAMAHYQFSRSLIREFNTWHFRKYAIKYAMSTIKNLREVFTLSYAKLGMNTR